MQHKVQILDPKGNLRDVIGGTFTDFEDAMHRVERQQELGKTGFVVHTETHPGYEVFRNRRRKYGLVLTASAGTDTQHYISYLYLSNEADWDGDTYCASKTYKTYKGACKKVRDYLDW